VDDLVEGFLRFMDLPAGEDAKPGFPGPINLGNPEEFSMIELAQLVLKVTGSQSKLVFLPIPLDDPKQRKPDISLARELLNWEPKIKLEQGVIQTVNYFKSILFESANK
jgi:UDP-glucuronate decarboxylase